MDEQQYKKAKKQVQIYEEKRAKEKEKAVSKWIDDHIGKTYVYRNNNYGCSDNKKWDLFLQIIGKKNKNTAITENWQLIDPKNGIYEVKTAEHYLYNWQADEEKFEHYPKCSLKEFERNKKKIMKLIEK